MPLNPWLRALLNHTIDHQMVNISPFVKNCRTDTAKNAFHLRNPEDFALGMTLGSILESFRVAFRAAFERDLYPDEMLEVITIVYSRADQIRNAIVGVSN